MISEVRRNASTICTFETRFENSEKERTNNALDANENSFKLALGHFSNRVKLVRVQVWVNKFLKNCQLKPDARIKTELQPEEIENFEIQILRKAQKDSFHDEYVALGNGDELSSNSKLFMLMPKLDEDSVMENLNSQNNYLTMLDI